MIRTLHMIRRVRRTEQEMRELYEGCPSYDPVQWYRRRKMDPPQWALDCKEKMHHPYLYIEDPKRKKINDHVKCNNLVRRLGIKSSCREIHHFAGNENWNTFIYIWKTTHDKLHYLYGRKNEDVGIDKLLKHIDELVSDGYALFVDGKLVEYTKHLNPDSWKMKKLGMNPRLIDESSTNLALNMGPRPGAILNKT
jgi:hypothetical protein